MKHNALKFTNELPEGWVIVNDGAFTADPACAILQDSKYCREDKLDRHIAATNDADSVVYCYSVLNDNDEFEGGCHFYGEMTTDECYGIMDKMLKGLIKVTPKKVAISG